MLKLIPGKLYKIIGTNKREISFLLVNQYEKNKVANVFLKGGSIMMFVKIATVGGYKNCLCFLSPCGKLVMPGSVDFDMRPKKYIKSVNKL